MKEEAITNLSLEIPKKRSLSKFWVGGCCVVYVSLLLNNRVYQNSSSCAWISMKIVTDVMNIMSGHPWQHILWIITSQLASTNQVMCAQGGGQNK